MAGSLSLFTLVASSASGCGGEDPRPFSSDDDTADTVDASKDAAVRHDGSADDGAGDFGDLEGGASASPCVAGVYAGSFDCNVALFGGLFMLPLHGPISYTFVQTETASGEFTTLGIAPGARMQASDNLGDGIGADLAGTLDCETGKLTGNLINGTFTIGGALGPDGSSPGGGNPIPFTGPLSGAYSGSAATPAIENGTMGPCTSAQLGGDAGPVANCTWSARLTSGSGDAGADR